MLLAAEDPLPNTGVIIQLVIILVLTLINAFLAASELSILSANQYKIDAMAEKGNKKAILVKKLRENETKFLSTIQVGITLAGFFSSATAAVSLSEGLAVKFSSWGIPFSSQIALVLVTLILSYFTLVFGELFPKRIALRNPEKIALMFARPINVIRIVFKPIVWLLSGSCELLVKIFRIKPKKDDKVTEDEVMALVSSAVEDGTIGEGEQELINSVFTFGNLKIRDVMTPRINVSMIDISEGVTTIKRIIKEEKYTRFPVYDNDKDNVIGILNIKDIFYKLKSNYTMNDLKKILRKPMFVNENMSTETLFSKMKNEKEHCAIVIDKNGSVSGFVTMEDIIEEVMGNINDEYDEEIEMIKELDEQTYLIDGSIPLQDLDRQLDINIRDENVDYSTLAGLVSEKLEGVYDTSNEIFIEEKNIKLEIVDIENNRIKTIKLTKIEAKN